MWYWIADRGSPCSDDRFRFDLIGEPSIDAASAECFQERCFLYRPHFQERTLVFFNPALSLLVLEPYQTVPGTQPSLRTWFAPCAVSHALTCHQSLSRLIACVIHTDSNLNSVAAANHLCNMLHTYETTMLHCTAWCVVLCQLILSLTCVLSGCTVTSRQRMILFSSAPCCVFREYSSQTF
jgi:hypothetical protein